MYYHVLIETTEKIGKSQSNRQLFDLDNTDLKEIENRIVKPFLQRDEFQIDGYFLNSTEVRRLVVKQTSSTTRELSEFENEHMPPGIIMYVSPSDIVSYDKYTKDITVELLDRVRQEIPKKAILDTRQLPKEVGHSRVFIVHGRDEAAKNETARFVENLGLIAVILHEQVNAGDTIIDKLEKHTNVGFGIILYTPCDVGGLSGDPAQKKRARQNVIFEHGYLIAKLGRKNVCALVTDDVEIPNDINGIVYVQLDRHGAWRLAIARELRNAGYLIDMNKIL